MIILAILFIVMLVVLITACIWAIVNYHQNGRPNWAGEPIMHGEKEPGTYSPKKESILVSTPPSEKDYHKHNLGVANRDNIGHIRLCSCGTYFQSQYAEYSFYPHWVEISAWKANRIIKKHDKMRQQYANKYSKTEGKNEDSNL